jgi:hypothetical protein
MGFRVYRNLLILQKRSNLGFEIQKKLYVLNLGNFLVNNNSTKLISLKLKFVWLTHPVYLIHMKPTGAELQIMNIIR